MVHHIGGRPAVDEDSQQLPAPPSLPLRSLFKGSRDRTIFQGSPPSSVRKISVLMLPTIAVFDLNGSVQMVNKCWREQVEEGEQKSREAKIGTVFLIDRGETQPAFLPSVGDMQSCTLTSPLCLHRCGLCHSSVLTSRLRRTGGRHLSDQMWWVWMKLACQFVLRTRTLSRLTSTLSSQWCLYFQVFSPSKLSDL